MMKDIVITAERVRKELTVVAVCFAVAFGLNIAAIIIYVKPWHEMFTQIGFVIVITAALYAVAAFFRILYYMVKRLICR